MFANLGSVETWGTSCKSTRVPPTGAMASLTAIDQRLSLMSTQAAPGANPKLHGNFDLPN